MKWLPTAQAEFTVSTLEEKRWPMYPSCKMKMTSLYASWLEPGDLGAGRNIPIDGCDHIVLREARVVGIVEPPDRHTVMVVSGPVRVKRIVNRDDK